MKTISSIQLNNKEDNFEGVKFGLKVSVLLAASFVLLNAFGIPMF
jgi:hypothetical protein